MIIAGLKDTRIRDWLAADRARICALTFPAFMIEFRCNYLDEDWEESTRRELLSMSQGSKPFWDFAVAVQSKNSLLSGTASHLEEDKLRHQLEAAMEERLSKKCTAEKTNKIVKFKEWLSDVKRVDDLLRAERKEFEAIAKNSREAGRRQNALAEPSRRFNSSAPNSNAGRKSCPKLTDMERQLLYDNEGCLKCCRFFVTHRSADCPNDFPAAAGYKLRTQADVERAKRSRNKPVAAVAVPSVNDHSYESESSLDHGIHPVAAVFAGIDNPVAYMPANGTNVVGNGTDSEDSDVSTPSSQISPLLPNTASPRDAGLAPFHVPHIYWRCKATGPKTEFPVTFDALFDHGSHAVLISEAFASQLGLRRRNLPSPETVELAMQSEKKKIRIELNEWVKLRLSDPSALWTSKSVRAIVAPGLCAPVILGLPFLSHNNIVIDHAARTAIDKTINFDLLNPVPPPPPPPPKTKLKDLFQQVRQARKLMVAELKWVLSVRRRERPTADDPVKPFDTVATVRTRIETLSAQEKLSSLGRQIINEFANVFNPIPHIDKLPTDVYCRIKLKDPAKTIATRSYSTPPQIPRCMGNPHTTTSRCRPHPTLKFIPCLPRFHCPQGRPLRPAPLGQRLPCTKRQYRRRCPPAPSR